MSKTRSGLPKSVLKVADDNREEWEQHADAGAALEDQGEDAQWQAKAEYEAAYAGCGSEYQVADRVGKSRSHIHWIVTMVTRSEAEVEGATFADTYAAAKAGLTLADYLRKVELGGLKESVHVEWYTPARYIDAAREVMGGIDLDPASNDQANETVRANTYFAQDDEPDGLGQDWFGRVWLNPPYGKGSGLFTTKLVAEHAAGRVEAGVLLINAYGFDSEWFQPLFDGPLCFTDHRIQFVSPLRESGGPANGNVFAYLGPAPAAFAARFAEFGTVVRRWA